MSVTDDPTDPRLTRGADPATSPYQPQAEVYLVLSQEERAKGFVRPVRRSYWHTTCGKITTMGQALAAALASVLQQRKPTDEQISWLLEDADEVVDDFDPAPERWRVRRLPAQVNDGPDEIEVRLRINGVTYVGLEGGKDCKGALVKLSAFRSWRAAA